MYRHLLVFTDDDREILLDSYHDLVQQLEVGAAIERQSIEALAEIVRVLLMGQKGLEPFWEEVRQQPDKSHHLHLTHPEKELLNLPWQLAFDKRLFPSIHLSKGPVIDLPLPAYQPQPGPLRILVMISSPDDLEYDRRLSYEEEEEIILKALAPLLTAGQVQVHFTEDGSLENLQQKLRLQHYHILYFSGHGIYKNGAGYLLLEDALTLRSKEIKAQELVQALQGLQAPPLMVLSSCQTAQGRMEDGFRGVADELIHQGVPAVIAMAFRIKDQYTILFAGHLFEQLADKRTLPEAYSRALEDLRMQEQQDLERSNQLHYRPGQWLIPQLYLSRPVEEIVDCSSADGGSFGMAAELVMPPFRFLGRRRESAALFNELVQNKPVLITGQGGIGKTALAEYVVKRLTIRDATYHCFAFDETTIGEGPMVAQLLQYLKTADPAYSDPDEWDSAFHHLDHLVQRVTKLCKPIWLFDSLEDFAEGADPWLDYVQRHLFFQFPVLLVSRYEIPVAQPIFALRLNQAPFVDFYRKYLSLDLRNLHAAIHLPEAVTVARLLYRMFGGSYRTLEFLNEVYVNDPEKTRVLMQQISTLKEVAAPAKELMQGVHEKLERSGRQMVVKELLELLTREERKTLHLLLYFDRPVLALALEMQQDGKNFDADLQRLRQFTLIEEKTNKEKGLTFYYVAPLVRNSVEGVELPQVYFYKEHAGDYCFKAASEITKSFDDLEDALTYFYDSKIIPKLNEVGAELTNNYYKFGLFTQTLRYCQMVETVAGDQTAADVLNNMGMVYLKYGNPKQALVYFTRFSIAARKEKKDGKLALAFNAIGQTHVQLNDPITALEWLEKSLDLSRSGGFESFQAVTLSNIGQLYCALEEDKKAMKAFQESLQIRKKIGDRKGQAFTLNNICAIYGDRGEHEKVRETLQEALEIAVEIDDKQLQGMLLNNLGSGRLEAMDYNAALIIFQKNLAISESVDDEEEVGKALMGMGLAYKHLGKHNEAVEYLTKGALILQKFDPEIQSESALHLGEIYIDRGDAAEALPFLEMSLANRRKANRPEEVALILFQLADTYLNLDEPDKAIKHLEECLVLFEKTGNKEMESLALNTLAKAYAAKDDPDKGLDAEEKNLELQRAMGNRGGEAIALQNIASAYMAKGMPELYLYYALQAYDIQSGDNNLSGLFFLSSTIGAFLCDYQSGKYVQKGLLLLEQAYEIGISSSEFPGVEMVGTMIDEIRQRPGKKKNKSTK